MGRVAGAEALGPAYGKFGYVPSAADRLARRVGHYDALIASGLWQYQTMLARAVWRRTGLPYFIFPHGMLDPYFGRSYRARHLKKVLYWNLFERHALRDAAAVLFTSDEERLLARQSFAGYACNDITVKYGTAAPGGSPDAQKRKFLEAYPGLARSKFILFIGRIHHKKGCDLLLRAFAAKAERDPDLRLVIAGPDESGLQAQFAGLAAALGISDRTIWTGMLTGDLKWGAMRCADAMALFSHQENFGIVVAEALAASLPVLISNKVNIWREIQADGAGIVTADTESGALEALGQWLALPAHDKMAMRQRALACFNNRFEISAVARFLATTLEESVRRVGVAAIQTDSSA